MKDPLGKIVQIAGAPWRVIGIASKPGPKVVSGFMIGLDPLYLATAADFRRQTAGGADAALSGNPVAAGCGAPSGKAPYPRARQKISLSRPTNSSPKRCKTSDSMSLLITAIAAISLLVGGVG